MRRTIVAIVVAGALLTGIAGATAASKPVGNGRYACLFQPYTPQHGILFASGLKFGTTYVGTWFVGSNSGSFYPVGDVEGHWYQLIDFGASGPLSGSFRDARRVLAPCQGNVP